MASTEHKVRVNLVHNDKHPIFFRQCVDPCKFLRRAAFAGWIVRITKDEGLDRRITELAFHISPVKRHLFRCNIQHGLNKHAVIHLNRRAERRVGRGIDEHLVSHCGNSLNRKRNTRHDTSDKFDPFRVAVPTVLTLHITGGSVNKIVCKVRIAVNRPVRHIMDHFTHRCRALKMRFRTVHRNGTGLERPKVPCL